MNPTKLNAVRLALREGNKTPQEIGEWIRYKYGKELPEDEILACKRHLTRTARKERALPANKGRWLAVACVAGLVLFVAVLVGAVFTPRSKPLTRPGGAAAEPVRAALDRLDTIPITAIWDYRRDWQNRIHAEQTYKGKICRLSGVVGRVDKGPSVSLVDPKRLGLAPIICHFQQDETKGLAELVEGDVIDVIGICHTERQWWDCLLTHHQKIGR